jgi:hypothetical protein
MRPEPRIAPGSDQLHISGSITYDAVKELTIGFGFVQGVRHCTRGDESQMWYEGPDRR